MKYPIRYILGYGDQSGQGIIVMYEVEGRMASFYTVPTDSNESKIITFTDEPQSFIHINEQKVFLGGTVQLASKIEISVTQFAHIGGLR
jgi:hypothetical protein